MFAGVYLFFLFLLQNICVRTASPIYKKNIKVFTTKFSIVTTEKNHCIIAMASFRNTCKNVTIHSHIICSYFMLDLVSLLRWYLSYRMGKPTISTGENKGADQLRSNCEADQHLCFRYKDSTIPLLSKSKVSSLVPSSVTVQPGLCRHLVGTQIAGFLTHRLI